MRKKCKKPGCVGNHCEKCGKCVTARKLCFRCEGGE